MVAVMNIQWETEQEETQSDMIEPGEALAEQSYIKKGPHSLVSTFPEKAFAMPKHSVGRSGGGDRSGGMGGSEEVEGSYWFRVLIGGSGDGGNENGFP